MKKETQREQAKDRNSEGGGITGTVNDFWLKIEIKAKLLVTRDVTLLIYLPCSIHNGVFFLGKAKSREELE